MEAGTVFVNSHGVTSVNLWSRRFAALLIEGVF
jgi:hypothetical protein